MFRWSDGIKVREGRSVLRVRWWRGLARRTAMAALKVYFDKHSWGNTVLDDLLVELERTRP